MRSGAAIGVLALLTACSTQPAPTPLAAALPPDLATPHPNSINGLLSRPWHHVGTRVTPQRQAEDEAKCKVVANTAAPSGDEARYYVTYINCLKASGYQPDPP